MLTTFVFDGALGDPVRSQYDRRLETYLFLWPLKVTDAV